MTQSSSPSSTITLPDGRTASVRGFSGNAQKILSDQKRMLEGDGFEAIVREVAQIEGKPLTTDGVKALRVGSRDAILIAARRRTYGDVVKDKVQCAECGERYEMRVNLAEIATVPYPEGDITLRVDGHEFVLGWLTVRHENDHAEGERKKIWGATDLPLLTIKTVDGERLGPKLLLDFDGATLDAVRKAVRLSVPLHRTEPEREPVAYEPPFDAIPVGGTATRVETWCPSCEGRNVVSLTGLMDFLFRGLRSLKD